MDVYLIFRNLIELWKLVMVEVKVSVSISFRLYFHLLLLYFRLFVLAW